MYSFMLLLTGAAAAATVSYPDPVCAVRGSTVVLPCTFTPQSSFTQGGRLVPLKIIRVRWCVNHEICQLTTPSVYDSKTPTANPRYKYLGDMTGNCTLQISDIQEIDSTTFRFRMEADNRAGHFTGKSGVNVTVIDFVKMKIQSSEAAEDLNQNQHVTLTCSTSVCNFHQLEVTWFKDGNALLPSGPTLQLGPLTAKDSGNYTCALKTNQKTTSLPFAVRVEEEEEEEEKGLLDTDRSDTLLILGVLFGVLLLLSLILFLIRRKVSAAGKEQTAGGEMDQKQPDIIYSNFLPPAERQQEVEQEVEPEGEEVSYASVQFRHTNPARAPEQEAGDVIYSSLASK
ncbi:advanced glycosylation end product-specific receptor-like [Scomber japonicus]|uniref:advanced glycosylation end product-specific receptor-like n=1 Tax=Scomber japonicus TaxID=13676 RepID=UPI002305F6E2|nr:advanced glycosylation end product-specific receptor-like [Scomber japonicus]